MTAPLTRGQVVRLPLTGTRELRIAPQRGQRGERCLAFAVWDAGSVVGELKLRERDLAAFKRAVRGLVVPEATNDDRTTGDNDE